MKQGNIVYFWLTVRAPLRIDSVTVERLTTLDVYGAEVEVYNSKSTPLSDSRWHLWLAEVPRSLSSANETSLELAFGFSTTAELLGRVTREHPLQASVVSYLNVLYDTTSSSPSQSRRRQQQHVQIQPQSLIEQQRQRQATTTTLKLEAKQALIRHRLDAIGALALGSFDAKIINDIILIDYGDDSALAAVAARQTTWLAFGIAAFIVLCFCFLGAALVARHYRKQTRRHRTIRSMLSVLEKNELAAKPMPPLNGSVTSTLRSAPPPSSSNAPLSRSGWQRLRAVMQSVPLPTPLSESARRRRAGAASMHVPHKPSSSTTPPNDANSSKPNSRRGSIVIVKDDNTSIVVKDEHSIVVDVVNKNPVQQQQQQQQQRKPPPPITPPPPKQPPPPTIPPPPPL